MCQNFETALIQKYQFITHWQCLPFENNMLSKKIHRPTQAIDYNWTQNIVFFKDTLPVTPNECLTTFTSE